MSPMERPLPDSQAVEARRSKILADIVQCEIEVNCSPWWRWRRKRDLHREINYMDGLQMGLYLGNHP